MKTLFPKFENRVKNGKRIDMVDENGRKIEKMYTLNEIRARLLESEFDFQTNFDDEYDLFFFLPNEKLILAGEVKQAMINGPNATAANDKQSVGPRSTTSRKHDSGATAATNQQERATTAPENK